MKDRHAKTISCLSFTLCTMMFAGGCGSPATGPDDGGRMIINNNEAYLATQVTYFQEKLPLYSQDLSTDLSHLAKINGFEMNLIAEVKAPRLNGFTLHASHVTKWEEYVVVSYSTKDDDYRGGVQIFDTSNIKYPRLISQLLLPDTDVTIGIRFGDELYLAEATDSDRDANFQSPACLEVITLKNDTISTTTHRIDLRSFNANDIACFDSTIFVTTGTTGGGLSMFDLHGLNVTEQIDLDAAKALGRNRDYLLLLEGTGTKLHFYDRRSHDYMRTLDLGCENLFQSKAEMIVVGKMAYLSGWKCGMMAVDLNRTEIVGRVPPPNNGETNSVSVEDDLLFMANGADGLSVVLINGTTFTVLGRVRFEGSTNYVAAHDGMLYIANGIGGLKIVEIKR